MAVRPMKVWNAATSTWDDVAVSQRGDVVNKTDFAAKGDIIAGTGTSAYDNFPAGSNGEVLTADSTTASGLRWQPVYNAGRNRIINGNFAVWQRGTSRTVADGEYGPDRLRRSANGTGTLTFSRESFTPGNAIDGYEPTFFCRYSITSPAAQGYNTIQQPIEDVRTFAGQTMTFSMWAKTTSGTLSVTPELHQYFGVGGSSDVVIGGSAWTVTTSWQRFSVTFSTPSISGKTLGSNNWFAVDLKLPLNTALTLDLWGMQAEAGSVATRFEEEPIEATLRKCQRYYYRQGGNEVYQIVTDAGNASSSTGVFLSLVPPTTMRVRPTSIAYGNLEVGYPGAGALTLSNLTLPSTESSPHRVLLNATTTGATANATYWLRSSNSLNGFLALEAEL